MQNLYFLGQAFVLFAQSRQFRRICLLPSLGLCRAKRFNLKPPSLQLRAGDPKLLGHAALCRAWLIKPLNRSRLIFVRVVPSMLSHSVPLSWTGVKYPSVRKQRRSSNLSKQLPRIPAVNSEDDFWAFVAAGRELGDLHVGYETVEPYPVTIAEGDLRLAQIDDPVQFYRVEQMKFAGKRPNLDKTKVHYNPRITMTDIPLEAYDYVVNGKPALEWVMERQCVKTDKKSGIVNDANDYANETMNNPAYPLELFQRVITVSLETQRIVNNLPALDID